MKCKGCEERYLGCHDHCEAYLEWKKEQEEKKQLFAMQREISKLFREFYSEKHKRVTSGCSTRRKMEKTNGGKKNARYKK